MALFQPDRLPLSRTILFSFFPYTALIRIIYDCGLICFEYIFAPQRSQITRIAPFSSVMPVSLFIQFGQYICFIFPDSFILLFSLTYYKTLPLHGKLLRRYVSIPSYPGLPWYRENQIFFVILPPFIPP